MKLLAAIAVFALVSVPRPAFAYRPFDGTDADVADEGDLEIELGPLGYLKTDENRFLVAPAAVLNLGFAHDWEAVVQGRNFVLLDRRAGEPRMQLVDTSVFLKTVLREGSLQEAAGPSIALEVGPLLPTIGDERGFGASAAAIVSQRWQPLTIHVNGAVSLTRAHHLDLFGDVIVEGPQAWVVRPVVETFIERDFGIALVLSGLAGAIWQVNDGLSFDAGVRAARAFDRSNLFELRAGLTWAISLWSG